MSVVTAQSSDLLRQVDSALKAFSDSGSNKEAAPGPSNSGKYYMNHNYLDTKNTGVIPLSLKNFISLYETDGKESSSDHSMTTRKSTDYDLAILGSTMVEFSDFNEFTNQSQFDSPFTGDMSDIARSMTPSTLSDLSYAHSRESTVMEDGEYMEVSSSQRAENSRQSSRAPRKRKKGAMKADKPVIPTLTGPLSELTKDYHHLPFRNMEEWVNRPAEVRWKEVEQRQGYVARPMNSFMLYRSAFAERTKFWCLQNNHQIVSSVSGASWPLEPQHIREFYNELAKTERKNHHAAHPGYKFSPSKAAQGKKRKTRASTGGSEYSTGFDSSVGQTPNPNSPADSSQSQTPPRPGKSTNRGANSWAYLGYPYDKAVSGPKISSWGHSNPGKPIPPPMDMSKDEMDGEYFQSIETEHDISTYPFPRTKDSKVVNVMIRPVQGPSPVVHHHICSMPEPMPQVPIDPRLHQLAADPNEMQNMKYGAASIYSNSTTYSPALYAPINSGFANFVSDSINGFLVDNGNPFDCLDIDSQLKAYRKIDGDTQAPASVEYSQTIDDGPNDYPELTLWGTEQVTLDPHLGMNRFEEYSDEIDGLTQNMNIGIWSWEEADTILGEEQVCYDEWLE